jgi:hypothetical protein
LSNIKSFYHIHIHVSVCRDTCTSSSWVLYSSFIGAVMVVWFTTTRAISAYHHYFVSEALVNVSLGVIVVVIVCNHC